MTDEPKATVRAKVLWEGVLRTESLIRGMELHTDEPKSFTGTNTAPTPLEVFVSSIGSCLLTTFVYSAMKTRANIEDCAVDVKAYTEKTEKKEKRLSRADITLTVWAAEEERARLEKSFELAKDFCIVTNAVNFPLNIELKLKNETH